MNTLVTVGCSVEGRRGGAQCSVSLKSSQYNPSSFWSEYHLHLLWVSNHPLFIFHTSEFHLHQQLSVLWVSNHPNISPFTFFILHLHQLSVLWISNNRSSPFYSSSFWLSSSSKAQCFVSSNYPSIIPISSFILLNTIFITSSVFCEFVIILLIRRRDKSSFTSATSIIMINALLMSCRSFSYWVPKSSKWSKRSPSEILQGLGSECKARTP